MMTHLIRITLLLLCYQPFSSTALSLIDGQSFLYDIGKNGALMQGTLGAYKGMYYLRVNDTAYVGHVASLSPDGREVQLDTFTDPATGLLINRNFYVSKTFNFARFTEILENPTSQDIIVNLELFGNLGSDNRTTIANEQSHFLITHELINGQTGNLPALLHYHSQVGHTFQAIHSVNGNQLNWHYPPITIPASSTRRLIYFIAQATQVDAAKQAATFIFNNPTALYEGMDHVAQSQLINWIPSQPTPTTDFSQVPFLNAGERRLGELTEGEALSQLRVYTPADAYAINLKVEETITLKLSAAFNAYLYLFSDQKGQDLIAYNDDQGPESTNAELVFTAPKAGTYYLEVTAHHHQERGPYTLEVLAGQVNHPPKAYPFEVIDETDSPTTLTFVDFSTDWDGEIVERCWQFGDGTGLTCTEHPDISHTFPRAGQYSVGLTLQDNAGAYAYQQQRIAIKAALEGVVLPVSNTVSGELATSDTRSQTRSNAFADRYIVQSLLPGQELVIEMKSSHFNSYLYLYDEFYQLVAQDDNSGGEQQARIRYTPLRSETLLIEATSFQDNALGTYTLTLELANNYPTSNLVLEASPFLHDPLQTLLVARLPTGFKTNFLLWDFGDNSPVVASNEAVVIHRYPNTGRFTTTVTAVDRQDQEMQGNKEVILMNPSPIPQVRFHATPLFGESPLRVFFTNESISTVPGNELTMIWQFGDGQVSTDTHPAHSFTEEGTYPVILETYSKLNHQSAAYTVPIAVINRASTQIPVTGLTRFRPQVLMAGLDPMLIDLLDTHTKIFALVRPGAVPVQTVRVMQNGSEFTLVMQHVATFGNGDQRYEVVLPLTRGILSVSTYANLFGDKPGQFRIQAIDQAGQFHAFPNLEIGTNPPAPTIATSLAIQPLRQVGIKRAAPQALAAGFDPALVDVGDAEFLVKALVREGMYPIAEVTLLQNQGEWSLPLRLQEVLPNGDKMYVLTYSFAGGSLSVGTLGSLFGDQSSPNQFRIKVTDQSGESHYFPELKVGNFPRL